MQEAEELLAQIVVADRNVEKHEAPDAVPRTLPLLLRVATAERDFPTEFGQTDNACEVGFRVALNQFLAGQLCQAPSESVAPGPGFKGVIEVSPRRARQAIGRPEQEVEQFFGLGFHRDGQAGYTINCRICDS